MLTHYNRGARSLPGVPCVLATVLLVFKPFRSTKRASFIEVLSLIGLVRFPLFIPAKRSAQSWQEAGGWARRKACGGGLVDSCWAPLQYRATGWRRVAVRGKLGPAQAESRRATHQSAVAACCPYGCPARAEPRACFQAEWRLRQLFEGLRNGCGEPLGSRDRDRRWRREDRQ